MKVYKNGKWYLSRTPRKRPDHRWVPPLYTLEKLQLVLDHHHTSNTVSLGPVTTSEQPCCRLCHVCENKAPSRLSHSFKAKLYLRHEVQHTDRRLLPHTAHTYQTPTSRQTVKRPDSNSVVSCSCWTKRLGLADARYTWKRDRFFHCHITKHH